MSDGFGLSRDDIASLGLKVIEHLRAELADTNQRKEWTAGNFDALRSFKSDKFETKCFPSRKGVPKEERQPEFLYDFVAYVQGKGILIAAESEWENKWVAGIKHDFEKLLYVRSPIKLMICRADENKFSTKDLSEALSEYMKEACADFSPGELFILYCVKSKGENDLNRDDVYQLQIEGEPSHRGLTSESFSLV